MEQTKTKLSFFNFGPVVNFGKMILEKFKGNEEKPLTDSELLQIEFHNSLDALRTAENHFSHVRGEAQVDIAIEQLNIAQKRVDIAVKKMKMQQQSVIL